MKSILSFVAVCAVACTLTACKTESKTSASPGAVSETKSECCQKEGATMGAVSEKKSGCCSDAKTEGASMGAVGEKKSGCCAEAKTDGASMGAVSEKSSCTGVCPMTGKSKAQN